MSFYTKSFYAICLLTILGFNRVGCLKNVVTGCGKASREVADSHVARVAAAEAAKRVIAKQRKAEDSAKSKSFKENSPGNYSYDHKQYNRLEDIPFQPSDNLFFNRSLRQGELSYLMQRGVKFIYNNTSYSRQKDKPFTIICLIPDDINVIRELYGLDEGQAIELKEYSEKLLSNKKILKVSAPDEMLAKQDEVLSRNEVPILVLHNSVYQRSLKRFNGEANFITCNGFEISADRYLTSLDLLDIRAIIEAVDLSHSAPTLEGFYNEFALAYHSYVAAYHQQSTLICLGEGVAGSGGYIMGYYDEKL